MTVPSPRGPNYNLPNDHEDFQDLIQDRRRWWIWQYAGQALNSMIVNQENLSSHNMEVMALLAIEQAQILVKLLEDKIE